MYMYIVKALEEHPEGLTEKQLRDLYKEWCSTLEPSQIPRGSAAMHSTDSISGFEQTLRRIQESFGPIVDYRSDIRRYVAHPDYVQRLSLSKRDYRLNYKLVVVVVCCRCERQVLETDMDEHDKICPVVKN
ncbi:hypothetical protein HYX70_03065 [Candidatus Saccharibacteria bacterium]|nr:hypothetical protein [Candidatus Saccharibacteria bacterium]